MKLTSLMCGTGLALLLAATVLAQEQQAESSPKRQAGRHPRSGHRTAIQVPMRAVTDQAEKAIRLSTLF